MGSTKEYILALKFHKAVYILTPIGIKSNGKVKLKSFTEKKEL